MRDGMRVRAVLAGAIGLLLLASPALGQGFFPGNGELRRRLDERLGRGGGVGVVVGLLDADGTRRFVAAGSSGNGVPLDEHALFEIGSITKPFTATLLADMASRGELSLDDPVAKHLPAGTRVPERSGKAITLATLATHSSGLPRMPTNFKPADPKDPFADYTVARLYEFLASYELPRDPGESWLYSNAGYGLLGHALERRAGTTYAKLLAGRVLAPLRMKETSVGLDPALRKRAVQGYDESFAPAPMWDLGPLPGAGAIRSTASDMLAFAAANLSADGDRLHAAVARVRELKAKEPSAWTFEEARFNAAGYRLLAEKRPADAAKVFTLSTELFPENGNPWDSLGEALLAAGEKEKAIVAYRRSVELDPKNRNGAEVLERLTKTP